MVPREEGIVEIVVQEERHCAVHISGQLYANE